MAQLDRTADIARLAVARLAVDRTRSGRHGGSIGLVLLVALVLAGAGAGLILVGRANAEPYILALLALLAMVGRVPAVRAGGRHLAHEPAREAASPLHQIRRRQRP